MEIIKVIVKGMPEYCQSCTYHKGVNYSFVVNLCQLIDRTIGNEELFTSARPNWCPLEKYCEICDGVGFVLHATKGTMPCPECNQESESE